MTSSQEINLVLGLALLVFGLVLYVQDKVAHEDGKLLGILYRFWFGKIGFRGRYETESFWDWFWHHITWVLGRRELTFFFQRRIRGFDDSAMWSLDETILRFTLPRLKAFRNLRNGEGPMGYPIDFDISPDSHANHVEWMKTVDKMIWSMEHWIETGGMPGYDPETFKEVSGYRERWQEGMDLFHIYFHNLWD